MEGGVWHLSAVARRLVLLVALLGGWANGGNSTCASCCAEISLMSMKGKDEKLKRLVQLEGVYRRVQHQVVNDRCVFKTSGGKRTLFFRAEHWIVAPSTKSNIGQMFVQDVAESPEEIDGEWWVAGATKWHSGNKLDVKCRSKSGRTQNCLATPSPTASPTGVPITLSPTVAHRSATSAPSGGLLTLTVAPIGSPTPRPTKPPKKVLKSSEFAYSHMPFFGFAPTGPPTARPMCPLTK